MRKWEKDLTGKESITERDKKVGEGMGGGNAMR